MRQNINLGIIQLKVYLRTYQCENILKTVNIKNNDKNKISYS